MTRTIKQQEDLCEKLSEKFYDLIVFIEKEIDDHGNFSDEVLDMIDEMLGDARGVTLGEKWHWGTNELDDL